MKKRTVSGSYESRGHVQRQIDNLKKKLNLTMKQQIKQKLTTNSKRNAETAVQTRTSVNSSRATSHSPTKRRSKTPLKSDKPMPLLAIQNFLSRLCSQIQTDKKVSYHSLLQVKSMTTAINDLIQTTPDLSLHFYNLVCSILKSLQQKAIDYQSLSQQLQAYQGFLTENKIRSRQQPVSKFDYQPLSVSQGTKKEALKQNIKQISVKAVNSLKQLNLNSKDLKETVKAFLVLISVIDRSLGVKQGLVIRIEPLLNKFSEIPGQAVQTVRKIIPYIESECIPISILLKVSSLLQSVNLQNLRLSDASGLGFSLFQYAKNSIGYYDQYYYQQYGRHCLDQSEEFFPSDKKIEALLKVQQINQELKGNSPSKFIVKTKKMQK